jgi:hypothetical protein
MELDASIEPTIGPYETYEDEWFGAKAAFEAFICLRDEAETGKLAALLRRTAGLEDRLPIEKKWRNPKLGALSPIRVVNEVFASGDAATTASRPPPSTSPTTSASRREGLQAHHAQERPGGEVRDGPAAHRQAAPCPADRPRVDFDAFFTHILMHELMHGLGPHEVPGAASPRRRCAVRPAQGTRQRPRGGQGRHLGPVGAAVPHRQGRARQVPGEDPLRHLPGLLFPHPALRDRPKRTARAWRCR